MGWSGNALLPQTGSATPLPGIYHLKAQHGARALAHESITLTSSNTCS